jgi:hypothetical protein
VTAVAGPTVRRRPLVLNGGVLALVTIIAMLAVAGGRDRAAVEPSHPETGDAGDQAPPAEAPREPAQEPGTAGDGPPHPLRTLPDTDDPAVYAIAVAEALHSIDSPNEHGADYEALFAAALWEEIVPEAREVILAAIYARIPDERMWQQMATVSQQAAFDADDVWEPRLGRQGVDAQWWPPGVVVRTVTGTQTETWHSSDGDALSSSRPVALSVVVACHPAASPCRLVGIQPTVEA